MQSRQRARDDTLDFIYAPNNITTSRFAVIVSTKIDKRAVKRNHMRRLIHESIHHVLPTIRDGWDCVVIIRKNMSNLKQAEVEQMMGTLLEKTGLSK